MEEISNGTEWYFDEATPGTGPRPEYLQDKYKSLADQAKAYTEVRKALGAQSGAPDAYDLTEFNDWIDPEQSHLKSFLSYAKDNRFNQDAVSTIFKTLVEYEKSFIPDEVAELQKLGPEGERKKQVVDQWAKNTLSAKAQETFGNIPKTAEVLEFLDEMRQLQYKARSQPPSSVDHASTFKPLSEKEVRNEMHQNQERYMKDPVYRAEISSKLEQVLGGGKR